MISTIIYTTRKDLIFLFAFALAHVVLELGAHGLRLVEYGVDVGLDGHSFLPAAHGSEGLGGAAPWSGWCMLLQCFNKRDLKVLLKGAYRKTGNEILAIARQRLMSSGIAHALKLKKGIRLRVYPRGGGFMITVKPHGKQGYHVNRFGLRSRS